MSNNKSKKQILDDFWDISALVPQKRTVRPMSRSVETVEITDGGAALGQSEQSRLSESTLITRFIPPHTAQEVSTQRQATLSYMPENSLIHKVTLYKENSTYSFYSEFCDAAKKLWNAKAHECEYVDFFSYSPQYDQLTGEQLSYYLWWRENFRKGRYIKINLFYIMLYTFELINTADESNARYCRDMMLGIVKNYPDIIDCTKEKYIRWICDLGLIYRLDPPKDISADLLKSAGVLKEYFVRILDNTPEGWAEVLLQYCCSYDYKKSKFATSENLYLYDTHIPAAIAEVVKTLSADGKILSGLTFDDCKICNMAFEGAVCSSKNRYTIEVEYCSFSRSHELRYLIGDVVKYAENKIRVHIGVKSKLTVYSLSNELREVIEQYFSTVLPAPRKNITKPEKRAEYEVLYDVPSTKLDLLNAERIEIDSWSVTRELTEAFDDSPVYEQPAIQEVRQEKELTAQDIDLMSALGEYAEAMCKLKQGDVKMLKLLAEEKGKALEAIVDVINELAVDVIGDMIIEEIDDGYAVIEDYCDMIN